MAQQRRGREEWQRLVELHRSSGLTQQAFATEQGLHVKSLENWIYRLRREAMTPATPAQFLPVKVRATKHATLPAHDHETVEVVLGNDVRVRFSTGTDCAYLGRLFATVVRYSEC